MPYSQWWLFVIDTSSEGQTRVTRTSPAQYAFWEPASYWRYWVARSTTSIPSSIPYSKATIWKTCSWALRIPAQHVQQAPRPGVWGGCCLGGGRQWWSGRRRALGSSRGIRPPNGCRIRYHLQGSIDWRSSHELVSWQWCPRLHRWPRCLWWQELLEVLSATDEHTEVLLMESYRLRWQAWQE